MPVQKLFVSSLLVVSREYDNIAVNVRDTHSPNLWYWQLRLFRQYSIQFSNQFNRLTKLADIDLFFNFSYEEFSFVSKMYYKFEDFAFLKFFVLNRLHGKIY